ncbi:MAG: type IV pilus twitching motility protein PilT [Bdellovibrio sp.]
MAFSKENLTTLIQLAVQHKASDIHIRTDEQPSFRIRGELMEVQSKPFQLTDVIDIAKIAINKEDINKKLDQIQEYDGGFAIPNLCRIRFNFFRYSEKAGIIFRIITETVPSLAELKYPEVLAHIAENKRGLILVTGATGSGKSTTLAAMIDHINSTRKCHIVTIEDPIEFMHKSKKSKISQREIGKDTKDFNSALRSALRQDPDVILIGEMRDPETVQIALKASETGHVVFSTVHTTNVISTIGRIISMFPPEEQADVRKRLSVNLQSIISQRMLKRADTKGVVIAQEIMVTTPGVKECIEGSEPLERIIEILEEGSGAAGNGSQTFDQHIYDLYKKGRISRETALESVASQSNFLQKLNLEG